MVVVVVERFREGWLGTLIGRKKKILMNVILFFAVFVQFLTFF